MTTLTYVQTCVIPAAFALLPAPMRSDKATAFLLAIGLQESEFETRHQGSSGPARGFWQFEISGTRAVLDHPQTIVPIASVLETLRYPSTLEPVDVFAALTDQDVLAACFARCLLWTLPESLPGPEEAPLAWRQYRRTWRPGKPRPETWQGNYTAAWALVHASEGT